ncbi:MAG: hypothetical protein AAFV53_00990 [Myxococcota bacterium]
MKLLHISSAAARHYHLGDLVAIDVDGEAWQGTILRIKRDPDDPDTVILFVKIEPYRAAVA